MKDFDKLIDVDEKKLFISKNDGFSFFFPYFSKYILTKQNGHEKKKETRK